MMRLDKRAGLAGHGKEFGSPSDRETIQFSSVSQVCPILCNPMNHNTPGLPVHHQLPEFTQTHAH